MSVSPWYTASVTHRVSGNHRLLTLLGPDNGNPNFTPDRATRLGTAFDAEVGWWRLTR